MTGPEHYRTAEALLESVSNRDVEVNLGNATIAAAQAHATLALAAATIETVASRGQGDVGSDWTEATS